VEPLEQIKAYLRDDDDAVARRARGVLHLIATPPDAVTAQAALRYITDPASVPSVAPRDNRLYWVKVRRAGGAVLEELPFTDLARARAFAVEAVLELGVTAYWIHYRRLAVDEPPTVFFDIEEDDDGV
jgi:hypothetical protein